MVRSKNTRWAVDKAPYRSAQSISKQIRPTTPDQPIKSRLAPSQKENYRAAKNIIFSSHIWNSGSAGMIVNWDHIERLTSEIGNAIARLDLSSIASGGIGNNTVSAPGLDYATMSSFGPDDEEPL